jgi:hypothetical protein
MEPPSSTINRRRFISILLLSLSPALIDQAEGEPTKRGPYKPRQPKADATAISNRVNTGVD